jgi:hypothetical protein
VKKEKESFKMKKLLLATLFLIPVVANAAQCGNNCDQSAEDDDGSFHEYSYVGFKGGVGQYKTPTSAGSSNSYGATFGHRYSQLFGAEAEYTYLGNYRDAVSSGHATAFSVSALHYLNLTDSFAFIGKLGIAYTNTQNAPASGGANTNITYGLGIDWQVSCDVGLRLEFDRYSLNTPANTQATNAFFGVNLKF